ncbi:MAG: putative MFS family arabinose efflux permease [Woeseiaceae bacterium]|jgi:predicted MFS family arabinose efflux permease
MSAPTPDSVVFLDAKKGPACSRAFFVSEFSEWYRAAAADRSRTGFRLTNKHRITLLSFLAYFAMSGMLSPMGILSAPIAEHFGHTVEDITARFSWLTMGILVGAILALVVFDWIRLRNLMMLVYGLIAASLVSLLYVDNLALVGIVLGLVGVCSGIGLPGAALTISKTYETKQRASMLVITDGCFSIAGIFCSWLAVFLLAREFHWSGVYQFVALVTVAIIVLSAVSVLPATDNENPQPETQSVPWSPGVWLCLAALFLYTLGQWSILLWIPNYAESALGAAREESGQLIGQFWMGMFAAQIFVAWWVMKIGVRKLVMISSITTTLFSIPLWFYGDMQILLILATIWGFANLGLLKITLSFATQLVRVPTARLVSSLLLGATVGTAVSPWITSQIVVATDNHFVLQFGTGCYAIMTVLLFVAAQKYYKRTT